MKKLVLLVTFGMFSMLFGAKPVTVQVISAVYEKSITKEFDTKTKKTGFKVNKKVENGRYVVTLGSFKDEKSAQKALKIARNTVSSDAFVRPVERHFATASTPHTKEKLVANHKEESVKSVAGSTTTGVVEPKSSVATTTVASEIKPTTTSMVKSVEPKSTTVAVLSDCDKREMHKDEIAEAIRFYKTSPHHRFEPVVLRQ